MLFGNNELNESYVSAMKAVSERSVDSLNKALLERLFEIEVLVQVKVQELGFLEGAWYRPMHNIIVPASYLHMLDEGAPRHIMYAAQLHDVGNSIMKIEPTTSGADWENVDKREQHMVIGAKMAKDYLTEIDPTLSKEHLSDIVDTILEHDNPYLGRPMLHSMSRYLRSADRTFVPSVLSWYKDLIANNSDQKYREKAMSLGFSKNGSISPENFLKARTAFFFEKDAPLELDTGLASYNEGGKCEPCYTDAEKEIVSRMLKDRKDELQDISEIDTADGFERFFEAALLSETINIIR